MFSKSEKKVKKVLLSCQKMTSIVHSVILIYNSSEIVQTFFIYYYYYTSLSQDKKHINHNKERHICSY